MAWSVPLLEKIGGAHADVALIFSAWALKDPAAALEFLGTLGPGSSLTSGLDVFIESLPDQTPDALLAQAGTLPEGPLRQALTVKAWSGRYEKDPDASLQDLSTQPFGSLPPGLWTTLGEQTSDFDKGMQRLQNLPPDAVPDFLTGLLRNKTDMGGIGKFTAAIDSLTDPEQRSAAIGGLASQIAIDPAAAIPWAQTLPSEEHRLVADIIAKSTSDLPPLRKKELLDPLR